MEMDSLMGKSNSNSNNVCYCCVWKEGRGVVYNYTIGNHQIDNMAALCLEMIPSYHRCYFETIQPFTYAFFIDDAFVYFAILRHSLGNSHLLSFLHKFRDEFTRISAGADYSLSLPLQPQLLPAVRRLVASLEHVSATAWPAMNGDAEAGTSTKAPLLARPTKQDKKMMKKKMMKDDHAVVVRDIETTNSSSFDSSDRQGQGQGQGSTLASRIKSSSQNNARDKWCRQVRIVLAIDAAVCLVLFIIWLVICRGIECIRS